MLLKQHFDTNTLPTEPLRFSNVSLHIKVFFSPNLLISGPKKTPIFNPISNSIYFLHRGNTANKSSYVLLDSSISSSDSSAPEINLSSPLFVLTAVRFLLSLSESSCVTLVLWVSINESENIKETILLIRCLLGNFSLPADFFSKLTFSKNSFWKTISVSNR